jgi:hypothetical protein
MLHFMRNLLNVGMRVTNIWSHLGNEVGGFNNLGINLKDMRNCVYTEKLKSIETRDARALINHLQNGNAGYKDKMSYSTIVFPSKKNILL